MYLQDICTFLKRELQARETYKLPNILRRIVRFHPGWKWRLAASYTYMRKAYMLCPRPSHPEKYTNAPTIPVSKIPQSS